MTPRSDIAMELSHGRYVRPEKLHKYNYWDVAELVKMRILQQRSSDGFFRLRCITWKEERRPQKSPTLHSYAKRVQYMKDHHDPEKQRQRRAAQKKMIQEYRESA